MSTNPNNSELQQLGENVRETSYGSGETMQELVFDEEKGDFVFKDSSSVSAGDAVVTKMAKDGFALSL